VTTATSTTPVRAQPPWLVLPGVVALAGAIGLLAWYWRDGLPYDATSGVWLALADDWSRGVLYRPLHDATGFGGTRYMPLFFMLHGWLMQAGMPIIPAGVALTIASLVLLLGASYAVMRRLDVPAIVAASCAALMLSTISVQLLGIAVKADLLAAALNMCGVYFALRAVARADARERYDAMCAIICWTLAFSLKVTAIFGAMAALFWLIRNGRTRAALTHAAIAAILMTAVVVALNMYSDGRMAASFSAVADGGVGVRYALLAPWWLVRTAIQDPFFLIGVLLAAWLLVHRVSKHGFDFVATWFCVTFAGTVLIFATPGTDTNHLVDLIAVSAVVIALEAPQRALHRPLSIAFALLIAISWLPGLPGIRQFFAERGRPTLSDINALQAQVNGPLLAENPTAAILLGVRAEVLDPFSLRLLAHRDSAVARDFAARMTDRYETIVLMDWSGSDMSTVRAAIDAHGGAGVGHFYGEMNFPAGFLEQLHAQYDVSAVINPFVVLKAR